MRLTPLPAPSSIRATWPRSVVEVERVLWVGMAFITALVMLYTASQSFPARVRALVGLAVTLSSAVAAAFFAHWRLSRKAVLRRRTAVAAGARILVGFPVWAFATVASAAGFAA